MQETVSKKEAGGGTDVEFHFPWQGLQALANAEVTTTGASLAGSVAPNLATLNSAGVN